MYQFHSNRSIPLELNFKNKKWANPGPFFVYLWSFQTNNTIFTPNQCEKCHDHPVYNIRRRDLNQWPFGHESSPITTRPAPAQNIGCSAEIEEVDCARTETKLEAKLNRMRESNDGILILANPPNVTFN